MLPEQRYRVDAPFRQLVDMLTSLIRSAQFTPSDLREAAVLAAIHYEMTRPIDIQKDILPIKRALEENRAERMRLERLIREHEIYSGLAPIKKDE